MGDSRMSQLLPTVRCGTCRADVPYSELGTHLCEEAPPVPDLPDDLDSAARSQRSGMSALGEEEDANFDDGGSSRYGYRAGPRGSRGSRDRPSPSSAGSREAGYRNQSASPNESESRRGYASGRSRSAKRESYGSQQSPSEMTDYGTERGPNGKLSENPNRYSRSTTGSNDSGRYGGRDRWKPVERGNDDAYGGRTPRAPQGVSAPGSAYRGRDRSPAVAGSPSRDEESYYSSRSRTEGRGDAPATARGNRSGGRARRDDYDYQADSRVARDGDDYSDYSRSSRGADSRRRPPPRNTGPEDRREPRTRAVRERPPRREGREAERDASPPPRRKPSTKADEASNSGQGYTEDKYNAAPEEGERSPDDMEDSKSPTPPSKAKDTTDKTPVPERTASPSLGLNFFQNLLSAVTPRSSQQPDRSGEDNQQKKIEMESLEKSMSSLEIQTAKLSSPAKDDSSSDRRGKCASCNRGIYQAEAMYEAAGKMFHTSCFRCDECDIPLNERSRFVESDGRILCEKRCAPAAAPNRPPDRKSSESPPPESLGRPRPSDKPARERKALLVCYECQEPIEGRPVYAFRRPYHQEHLVCKECRKPINPDVGHVEHEGATYCPADFAERFLPKCQMCNQPINGEVVCALDVKWHPKCFGCQVCKQPFPNKSFYVLDNTPLCRRHYHERNGSICNTCNEPIEGACAQIQQDSSPGGGLLSYHPPCFTCTKCRVPLRDVYYNFKGKAYCERDIMEIQAKKNIKVERRRTQFSILPGSR